MYLKKEVGIRGGGGGGGAERGTGDRCVSVGGGGGAQFLPFQCTPTPYLTTRSGEDSLYFRVGTIFLVGVSLPLKAMVFRCFLMS